MPSRAHTELHDPRRIGRNRPLSVTFYRARTNRRARLQRHRGPARVYRAAIQTSRRSILSNIAGIFIRARLDGKEARREFQTDFHSGSFVSRSRSSGRRARSPGVARESQRAARKVSPLGGPIPYSARHSP